MSETDVERSVVAGAGAAVVGSGAPRRSWVGRLALACLRAIARAYLLLPGRARLVPGRVLGAILRWARVRSAVVLANLEKAFPADPALRERLFRESYEHLGHLVFEELLAVGPLRRFCDERVELRGAEIWRRECAFGKGAIFLSSHIGNWEVMAAKGALAGMDLLIVTKRVKPSWLHEAIEEGRLRCGVKGTYEPRTFRDVLGHLRKGGTVGFILDQYAGPPIGVRVPVFGVPVGTAGAIATVARRTGAPVLPVVNYRLPNGGMVVDIREPVGWATASNPQREIAENTARYASVLERDIREHAPQWLWIHKRFKGDLGPLREGEWDEGRVR